MILSLLLCASALLAGELKLGAPLTLKQQTAIASLEAKPAEFTGKLVQVKGKVVEVCEHSGCWMNLVDPKSASRVRIKVKDGEIVFPKDAIGRIAVAEGTFVRIDLTKDQLIAQMKHEAEENHKKFDPSTVTAGKTIYQIKGSGAVVLE
jgi:NMD protein affecting ribosome stability and mRNA decay